ncbi:MAG: M13 family metallopeptidase, partial [Clostridia bacterium]|nr:M13 family metallopeptidase [Clostridia bacterium]
MANKEVANKPLRIQDDLYQTVNEEWLKSAVIPEDLPVTGGFIDLMLDVEKTMIGDLTEIGDGKKETDMEVMKHAARLYQKAKDVESREKDGMKPILPLLERIRNLKDIPDFNSQILDLLYDRVAFPFDLDTNEDVRNTEIQFLVLTDPDTILPDKTLYDKALPRMLLLSSYKKMVRELLALTPLSKKEQKQYLTDTILFDDRIRKHVLSHADMADYVKLFNPTPLDEVASALQPLDLKGLLEKLYPGKEISEINICNPAYLKAFGEIFSEETFPLFVHWAYVKTILQYAPFLSQKICDLSHTFMNRMMGVKKPPEIEKQAYRQVSALYDMPMGIYYGRTYFGEEAKKDVTEMVKKIIETYKSRLRKNDFLLEETKEKAILKLDCMKIKMGYPDSYDKVYDGFVVNEEDSYFEAVKRILDLRIRDRFDRLNRPTDFNRWAMAGHVVNACYDPFKNDITFPAAFLQMPFYRLDRSPEENLGAVGAVIGHEISHAFDNNGSHLNEKGNYVDWWKEEDQKRFEEKTKAMAEQYDGLPYHGGKVNGTMVVSENIADNGGMAVTLEIMHT